MKRRKTLSDCMEDFDDALSNLWTEFVKALRAEEAVRVLCKWLKK
jgi:hypothetical protein